MPVRESFFDKYEIPHKYFENSLSLTRTVSLSQLDFR